MNPEYIRQCAAAKEVREAILDSLKLGSVVRFYDPLSKEVMHDIIGGSVADLPERQIGGFRKSPELVILFVQEQLWALLPKEGRYHFVRLINVDCLVSGRMDIFDKPWFFVLPPFNN